MGDTTAGGGGVLIPDGWLRFFRRDAMGVVEKEEDIILLGWFDRSRWNQPANQ